MTSTIINKPILTELHRAISNIRNTIRILLFITTFISLAIGVGPALANEAIEGMYISSIQSGGSGEAAYVITTQDGNLVKAKHQIEIDALQLLTFTLAIVGAFLGIFNTYRSYRQDQVHLKIIPMRGYRAKLSDREVALYSTNNNSERETDQIGFLGVTVINLSKFPVTIDEIGCLIGRNSDRVVFSDLIKGEGEHLPHRLEPRSQIRFRIDEETTQELFQGKSPKEIYVETSCGERQVATNSAFKALAKAHQQIK